MGDPNPTMHGISFKAVCTDVTGDKATFESLPGDDLAKATIEGEYAKGFKVGEHANVSFHLTHGGSDLGGDGSD